jgi:1-acyl-sn-glycerol-3-phosphate acyltransferase
MPADDVIAPATPAVRGGATRPAGPDRCRFRPRLLPRIVYPISWLAGRWVWLCTIRCKSIRPHLGTRDGAYILACTHLSHLEPFLLGLAVKRKIDWMSRIEFYASRFSAWVLHAHDAFPVRRFGVPVSAIRTSIARLRMGRCVGICPEGGVAIGELSVLRGGAIKSGACLLSQRTGAPIVPCVMVGTDKLNCVRPWLPMLQAKLWMAFGQPIYPPLDEPDRRAARRRMNEQLRQAYMDLYAELQRQFGITDADVP